MIRKAGIYTHEKRTDREIKWGLPGWDSKINLGFLCGT